MTTLIIENEYDIDPQIKAFLKDNPNLFEAVSKQTFALHRKLEDLREHIMKTDSILVASTWMYKDQLEEYLDLFANPKFPKKLKFFIHSFVNKLNSWKYDEVRSLREPHLFDKVVKVIKNGHEMFDYSEDGFDAEYSIVDRLNIFHEEQKRRPYVYHPMRYSDEHQLFYLEGRDGYELSDMIEDFKTPKE